MIGSALEGAGLESRESAAYGHIRRRFRDMRLDFCVPIRRHHRQRRPRGSQGNKPGDDHYPRYRRDANQRVSGSCSL